MNQEKFSQLTISGLMAGALVLTPVFATANPSGEGRAVLEEVVVTAARRAQNLQDVPVAVAAIATDELKMRNITDASDLGGSVTNLNVKSPFSKSQPNFTVRGIGVANEFNPNAQSPIGVYFDEIYQGFRPSHGAALYDLERIEVLKGPQGTLYGRNTTGGAINIITRSPELADNNGYLTVGIGNYNARTIQGAGEITTSGGEFGARLAFIDHERDGVINNVASELGYGPALTNEDYNSEDTTAARLSLRYAPGDDLDITLKTYFARNSPWGHSGVPIQLGPNETDLTGAFSSSVLGKRDSAVNRQGRFYSRSQGVQLRAEYLLNDNFTLTSLTGYDTAEFNISFDFDGTPSAIGEHRTNETDFYGFNQDFNISYSDERLNVIAGIYLGQQKASNYEDMYFFGFLDDIAGPNQFNPGVTTSVSSIIEYEQLQTSYAAYAEVKYDISDRWAVTVGARLTRDEVEFNDFYSLLRDSSFNPVLYAYNSSDPAPFGTLTGGITPEMNEKVTEPTGRIIFEYRTAGDNMIYGGYSRGYRSGSFNGQSIILPPNYVDPEYVDAYEAGFKSRLLDNTLQFNGAFFYNVYKGQQVQEVAGGASFLRSLDGEFYGAEFEATAQLSNSLRVIAGLGLLHTEYDDGQFLAPGDPFATDPRGFDIGGNEFPFAPKMTFFVNPEYTFFNVMGGELIMAGEVQYQSKHHYDMFNDDQAQGPLADGQGAYTLVNARFSYVKDNYQFAVWGKNLTDRYYNVFGINIESFGANYFVPGLPRTYGIEATYNF